MCEQRIAFLLVNVQTRALFDSIGGLPVRREDASEQNKKLGMLRPRRAPEDPFIKAQTGDKLTLAHTAHGHTEPGACLI